MMGRQASLGQLLKTLAGRIRARRKFLRLTQEQLAEQAGLSANYVARLELGSKTPSLNTLLRLSKALEIRIPELFAGESESSWLGEAQEIAHALQSLDESDAKFTVNQLRAIVNHLKSPREG